MDEKKKKKLKKTFNVNDTRRITDEMISNKLEEVIRDKELAEALLENNPNSMNTIISSVDLIKHSLNVTEENNKKENEYLYTACYGLLNELSIDLKKENLTEEQRDKCKQMWLDVIKIIADNNLLNKKYRLKVWNKVVTFGIGVVLIGAGIVYKSGLLKKFINKGDDELSIGENDNDELGNNEL